MRQSDSYLGAQFRRLKRRLDAPVATKAMAAKLARLIYRMLRYGMQFVDQGAEVYEAAHRQREIYYLKQKAASPRHRRRSNPSAGLIQDSAGNLYGTTRGRAGAVKGTVLI